MEFKEAYERLKSKFTSGNNIPVERNTILRTEWESIKKEIEKLKNIERIFNEEIDKDF